MTPPASHAQEVGDHVRVTLQDGRVAGRVTHVGDAKLEIHLPKREYRSIARADILLLERRVTGTAKGAAIGGGLALGLVGLALATYDPICIQVDDFGSICGGDNTDTDIAAAVAGVLVVGVLGTGLGALVGSAFRRWEPIATAGGRATPAIGLAVDGGRPGVELGGRLRF